MTLPPGFRFHPTDEELVAYYLKKRVKGAKIEFDVIADVDLYKCEPWDLPPKSLLPSNDLEWFFFSPRDRKYPNGSRTNRATEAGYWKATGRDRFVKTGSRVIGMKKTLVFYLGRAPQGERTGWLMHEYRLEGEEREMTHVSKEAFVLCRVFKKNPQGPLKVAGGNLADEGLHMADFPTVEKNPVFFENDVKPNMLVQPLVRAFATQDFGPVKQQQLNTYSAEATGMMMPSTLTEFEVDNEFSKTLTDTNFWEGFSWPEDCTRDDEALGGGGNFKPEIAPNSHMPKPEDFLFSQLYSTIPIFDGDISDLDFLPPLEDQSPSPPTFVPSVEDTDSLTETPQPTIQIRSRPAADSLSSSGSVTSPSSTTKRRILYQRHRVPSSLATEKEQNLTRALKPKQELDLLQNVDPEDLKPSTILQSETDNTQSKSSPPALINSSPTYIPAVVGQQEKLSSAIVSQSSVNASADHSLSTSVNFSGPFQPTSDLQGLSPTVKDIAISEPYILQPLNQNSEAAVDSSSTLEAVIPDSPNFYQTGYFTGSRDVESSQHPSSTEDLRKVQASSIRRHAIVEHNIPAAPVATLLRLFGSVCVNRASSTEYSSPDSKLLNLKGSLDLPPGIGSIHVNTVTITCSCSKVDNHPRVQATVCDCYSDSQSTYNHVLPGSWEKTQNHEPAVGKPEEMNSPGKGRECKRGFVCVFFLGAVSACFGVFLFQRSCSLTLEIH